MDSLREQLDRVGFVDVAGKIAASSTAAVCLIKSSMTLRNKQTTTYPANLNP